MKQHLSVARRCAAVATAVALTLGASTLVAPGADAKPKPKPQKGSVKGAVALTCEYAGTPFDYDAKIVLKGTRAKKGAAPVALTATMSTMPGVAPVPLDYDVTDALALTVGGVKTTLKGKGHVKAGAKAPVPIPSLKGSVKNKKNSLAVVVTKFTFTVLGSNVNCAPTESGSLGTLKLK